MIHHMIDDPQHAARVVHQEINKFRTSAREPSFWDLLPWRTPPRPVVALYAEGTNGAFGYRNSLPWKCPQDLEFFKAVTDGAVVIMGRRTLQSLPDAGLPGRQIFVVGERAPQERVAHHKAKVFRTIDGAIKKARRTGKPIFVIGGSHLLTTSRNKIDLQVISVIDYNYKYDTSAPDMGMIEPWSALRYKRPIPNEPGLFHMIFRLIKPL